MKPSIQITFIILLGLLLIGCDDDGASVEDQPPKMPKLYYHSPDIDSTYIYWTCEDPDGDALVYDVFFGGNSDPPQIRSKVSYNRIDFTYRLNPNSAYYFKVKAYDTDGYSSESEVRRFTTGESWIPLPMPPENPEHGDEWRITFGHKRIPLDMIYIEPGSFMMGAVDHDPNALDSEKPRHLVTIAEGFWIGKYEFTMWQHRSAGNQYLEEGEDSVLVALSWESVIGATNLFNEMDPGNPWRLPTEAEWEYCCRAGTETIYFWGDDPSLYTEYAVCNQEEFTGSKYGTKLPNPWGIHDMLGSRKEWCEDDAPESGWPGLGYEGAPTDGSPWIYEPRSDYHILRGGFYFSDLEDIRCSSRDLFHYVDNQYCDFRLVIDPQNYGD